MQETKTQNNEWYRSAKRRGFKSYTIVGPPEAIEAMKDIYRRWKAEHYHEYWKKE